jgi:hypothetical protein
MSWVPVAFAALLLAAVLYPVVAPFVARKRRARHAHRGGIVHWYPNYDDAMQFEPTMDVDIIPVVRHELERMGYSPASDDALVPRTFRRRIPGDVRFRLWTSADASLRPVWICCWQGFDLAHGDTGNTGMIHLTRDMLLRGDSAADVSLDASAAVKTGPGADTPGWTPRASTDDGDPKDRADRGSPRPMPRRGFMVPSARTSIRAARSRTHRTRTHPSRTRR